MAHKNRPYSERKWNRYTKGMRRIREDRAHHGRDRFCPCFDQDADHGRGITFSFFADTPTPFSDNWRDWEGPSREELRAPRITEWD